MRGFEGPLRRIFKVVSPLGQIQEYTFLIDENLPTQITLTETAPNQYEAAIKARDEFYDIKGVYHRTMKLIYPPQAMGKEQGAIVPKVNGQIDAMREGKKREWLNKGYPPDLVEKALLMADRWISAEAAAFSPPGREDVREAIIKGHYMTALQAAETWMNAMLK